MQPAFISLLLFAVRVSVLVDCRPRLRDPERRPQQQQQSSFYTVAHADTSTGMGHFYLEWLSRPKRRGVHKDFRGRSVHIYIYIICFITDYFINHRKDMPTEYIVHLIFQKAFPCFIAIFPKSSQMY